MSDKPNLEESFRDSLRDAVTIAEVLGPSCPGGVPALVGIMKLALEDDHQLRFLMSLVESRAKIKR